MLIGSQMVYFKWLQKTRFVTLVPQVLAPGWGYTKWIGLDAIGFVEIDCGFRKRTCNMPSYKCTMFRVNRTNGCGAVIDFLEKSIIIFIDFFPTLIVRLVLALESSFWCRWKAYDTLWWMQSNARARKNFLQMTIRSTETPGKSSWPPGNFGWWKPKNIASKFSNFLKYPYPTKFGTRNRSRPFAALWELK